MAYKVRAKRDGDGYNLEYGKGEKKLTVRLVKAGRTWRFIDAPKALLGQFPLLDTAKQAFETWAGQAYGGPIEDNPLINSPVSDKGTILDPTVRFGPPPTVASDGSPAEPPSQRFENTDYQGDYDTPDPLDPDNYTDIKGYAHVTAIGALRHVFQWAHSRYAGNYPAPFESVRRVLTRLYPNEATYQLPTVMERKP